MNFQLVLLSGLGFLIFTGFCLFVLFKVNKSNLSERSKKAMMFAIVLIITAFCIFIFDTYTADHIARNTITKP